MTRFALLAALLAACPAVAQPAKLPAELEKPLELFKGQKFDDCLEELKKATTANPALRPPRVILAEWFAKAGRGPDARLNLERAAADDPTHPEVYLMNANVAFTEGRVTDALLNLRQAQQLAADVRWTADQKKRFLLESRLGLAACYESRGDSAGVREALQAVLNDDPKNGGVRQQLAGAVFGLGKPEEAFAELTKAHADDPAVELPELRMATLWTAKANATAKLDEARAHRDAAEGWLKKAVAAHPKSARPFRAYANWLLDDGRPDAAAPYVDAAVQLEPTARDTLGLKGVLARHKKEYAAAEVVFEGLYKDAPNDPFALGNLALVLAESGDAEKQKRAINLALALIQQNSRSPDAAAVLGWCKLKAGRTDEAEEHFNAVLKAGGQLSLDTVYFVGKMMTERKKYEEAHKLLKAALDARGAFVYRPDASALLAEVVKQLPTKKDDPKK
jgi:tetratricopeptide (TPR) repeat protein